MTEDQKDSHPWLWALLLLLLLWWWWRWSHRPAASVPPAPAAAASPAPSSSSSSGQGGPGPYATFNPDNYADETRRYLNTIIYTDPITGAWANGTTFTGLYDAYQSLKKQGRDTSAAEQQMLEAIRSHYPSAY